MSGGPLWLGPRSQEDGVSYPSEMLGHTCCSFSSAMLVELGCYARILVSNGVAGVILTFWVWFSAEEGLSCLVLE
jgi:hypothetical protein